MANDVTYLGLSQSVIQRGNIMTKELYNGTPTGHYWYTGVSSIVFNVVFFGAHLTRDIGMEHSGPSRDHLIFDSLHAWVCFFLSATSLCLT